MLPEPDVHLTHVANIDKVTLKGVTAFKQFWVFTVQNLLVQVIRNGRHAAFMLFARAVNVEVTETGDRWQSVTVRLGIFLHTTDIVVELLLRVAVNIQRALVLWRFNKVSVAAAVGGG